MHLLSLDWGYVSGRICYRFGEILFTASGWVSEILGGVGTTY